MSSRIVARSLELEELIAPLSHEHQEQRKHLSELSKFWRRKTMREEPSSQFEPSFSITKEQAAELKRRIAKTREK